MQNRENGFQEHYEQRKRTSNGNWASRPITHPVVLNKLCCANQRNKASFARQKRFYLVCSIRLLVLYVSSEYVKIISLD